MYKFLSVLLLYVTHCLLCGGVIAGESKDTKSNAIELAQTEAPKPHETIVFGASKIGLKIHAQQSPEAAFHLSFDQTNAPRNVNDQLHYFESSQALVEAFNRGEVNTVLASPIEILALEDKTGDTMIAINEQSTPTKQSYVILVRKIDAVSDIKQLKNKRLSMVPLQDVAEVYLNTLLLNRDSLEAPAFFHEVFASKNADIAIMDVFFGKSDVTIVRESEYKHAISLNPQIGEQLAVLDKSPQFLDIVSASRKSIPEQKFKDTMLAVTGVTKTVNGKKLFKVINADALQIISRSDFSEVHELLTRYQTLSKSKEKTHVE